MKTVYEKKSKFKIFWEKVETKSLRFINSILTKIKKTNRLNFNEPFLLSTHYYYYSHHWQPPVLKLGKLLLFFTLWPTSTFVWSLADTSSFFQKETVRKIIQESNDDLASVDFTHHGCCRLGFSHFYSHICRIFLVGNAKI